MTSSVTTTQITRVESNDVEEDKPNEFSNSCKDSIENHSSDSDSDDDLEDTRFETAVAETDVSEEAIQKLKELFLRSSFNKLEIIQRKSAKNEVNQQMVSHWVLTDKKVDLLPTEDFKDENSKYLFESKSKLLEKSELKLRQKSERRKRKKKSLISDVQINRIPKTFEEFLDLIFDLKADLIFEEKSKMLFREETHNRDIRFQSHDSYINSFIPFVIREFWNCLKTNAKRELISHQMSYFKTHLKNEINLCYIRDKSCSQSPFKYGQIVIIKYPDIQNQDSNQSEVQSYFGVIVGVTTELIDKTSEHLSNPLFISQTNGEENDFIYEKLIIYCNPLAQTFERVCVTPLLCVQKFLLEARIVYELEELRFQNIFQQILKPRFKFGISGLSVNLEQRKELFDIQKDAIQKAYEVCCLPEMNEFSSFVAVYGGPKTGKTEILMETALQLLRTADQKVDKLIIIAMEANHLSEIIETLKKNEIKVFHIDSEAKYLSHKNSEFRRVIRRMNKDNIFDDITGKEYSIEQCLKYYGGEIQLTDLLVRDRYVKEIIDKRVVHKLIAESEVIVGSIASVMNNEEFNSIFNMNCENHIKCALIDEAHLLTETELLTLLYSGVQSFALFGDISRNAISYEKCESFLKRYVGLYSRNFQKTDPNHYSVLYLKETIASLKRLAESSRKISKIASNYRENGRRKTDEYRKYSNYGSEFFNRNDRFKDYKPFKTESKEDIKTRGVNNTHQKPENNRWEQSRPGQSQSNSQIPHNSLINETVYNSQRFSAPDLNRNDMSGANSAPNANNPSNGTQFMSNPTRHQNYNMF